MLVEGPPQAEQSEISFAFPELAQKMEAISMSQLSLGFLVFEYTYIHIISWTFETSQPRQAEMSHKYYRNWQKVYEQHANW